MRRALLTLALALLGAGYAQGLTVWTTFDDPALAWLRAEAASFSSGFGVAIDIVRLDVGELKQRAMVGAAEGEAADLFVGVPHDQVAELAVGGILADLSRYATRAYLADLSDHARLGFTFGGTLFGLPLSVEGPALIVNTDLVAEPPRTYEELLELAGTLTTADTYGFLADIGNFYFAYGWLHTYGGYAFGRDGGSLDPKALGLANDGAIAGAEALKALRFGSGLIPAGTTYDVANGHFVDGALAMIYNGPWAVGQYRAAGRNVTVLPMPPLADGTVWSGFMGVQGVLMNAFSPAQTDAANLAKWLTRTDALVALARRSGRIPPSTAALAEVQDDAILAGFGAALVDAEPIPNIPEMGAVWGPMARALAAITAAEDSDVAAALRRAVDAIAGR